MALLSVNMSTLVKDLLQDHEIRMEAVAGLRTNMRQELNNYRTAHQAMTSKQHQHLAKQMDGLRQQVSDQRQAAATFVGDLDKSNQSMAEELNLKLTLQRSRLATDTAAFINNASSAHQEMATQQARELSEQSANLRQNVKDLLQDSDAAHQSMAARQKKNMADGHKQLINDVTATRRKLQAEQNTLRTDLAEAARVWANISLLKQKRPMKKSPIETVQITKSPMAVSSPAEPSNRSDDLTMIDGIGPAMARLLYTGGISSFEQLAASTTEQLYQILGKSGKLAKVETWITQAQELTQ